VPFNDAEAVARRLAEHRGQVAAMILEPVMMNAGIIPTTDISRPSVTWYARAGC
jgi:glutamate-1-semialdehyde 2,1-aminomutase